MAVPKKRVSLTRRRRNRAVHKKTLPTITKCSNCNKFKLPHNMCPSCGFHHGILVKAPKIKKNNK